MNDAKRLIEFNMYGLKAKLIKYQVSNLVE